MRFKGLLSMLIIAGLMTTPCRASAYSSSLINGNFEDTAGTGIWTYVRSEIADNLGRGGSRCGSLAHELGANAYAFLNQGVANPVPGARYEVSAWIKKSAALTGKGFFFQYRFFSSATALTTKNLIESKSSQYWIVGEDWGEVTDNFVVPTNAKGFELAIVLHGNGGVLIDDVQFIQMGAPEPISFTTDWTFYYSDMTGNGIASIKPTDFYGSFTGTVDFELKDGDSVLARKSAQLTDGYADFEYALSLLSKKQHQYTVSAVVKDGNAVVQAESENVYRYDRPTRLTADGRYIVNAETPSPSDDRQINPVIMYGSYTDSDMSVMSEAGVNIITSYVDPVSMDYAAANDIMILGVLYPNMRPAAHADNIAYATNIINRWKDHPSIYGWILIDEPSYQCHNPWPLLEESYKLVRGLDPVHPVYVTEVPTPSRFAQSVKYADIFGVDPYVGNDKDKASFVADTVEAAVAAAKGVKPVYAIVQTFNYKDYFPTSTAMRGMIYQAFFAGAKGIGYYCFDNAQGTLKLNRTALWDVLSEFAFNPDTGVSELQDAFRYFSYGGENIDADNDVWFNYWVDGDGNVQVAALNTTNAAIQNSKTIGVANLAVGQTIAVTDGAAVYREDGTLWVYLIAGAAGRFQLEPGTHQRSLIANGSFEGGFVGWSTAGAQGTDILVDAGYLDIRGTTASTFAEQSVTGLTAGGNYRLTFLHKNATNGAEGYCPYVVLTSGSRTITMNGWTSIPTPRSADWVRYDIFFKLPEGSADVSVSFLGNLKGPYCFDDVALTEQSKPVVEFYSLAGFDYSGKDLPSGTSIIRHALTEAIDGGSVTSYPVKVKGVLASELGGVVRVACHYPQTLSGAKTSLISAIYSKADASLKDVMVSDFTFEPIVDGSSYSLPDGFMYCDVDTSEYAGGNYYMKAFLWDSAKGAQPVIDSEVLGY